MTDEERKLDALAWLRMPTTWAGDYADLPIVAWGILTRLVLASARRGPLPADRAGLARLAGVSTRELTRAWPSIAGLWEERDGHMRCSHVEAERQRMTERTEQMRELARRGAEARWGPRAADNDDTARHSERHADRHSARHTARDAVRHTDLEEEDLEKEKKKA